MKNAGLILNIILLVAVAVLFYLHFSSKEKTAVPVVRSVANDTSRSSNNFRIAYFELDSIESSFAMVKDITKDLNQKEQQLSNQLARMEKNLYDKAGEYQSRAKTMCICNLDIFASNFCTADPLKLGFHISVGAVITKFYRRDEEVRNHSSRWHGHKDGQAHAEAVFIVGR